MRAVRATWLLVLAACSTPPSIDAGSTDAPPDAPDPPLSIPERGHLTVVRRDDGRIDVADDRGTVYVRGAWAEALVREGGAERTVSSREACAGAWAAASAPPNDATYFADGEGWTFHCTEASGLSLDWRLWIDHGHDTLIVDVAVQAAAGAPELVALRLTSLVTNGDDGGLFVGGRPSRHRILDDGGDLVRDTDAFLRYPDARRETLADTMPIPSRGNVLANWNHAVVDLDGARSLVAGTLGVEIGFPTFGTTLRGAGPLDAATGRRGLSAYYVESALLFTGKPLHPGGSIRSEPAYLDPLSADPLEGLERYADAVAAWLDIDVWTERDGGRAVPTGWNSWSGGAGSGGLGSDIDQADIEENLVVMARDFAPFGVDYFQIDDGYQDHSGDWRTNLTRFPDGIDTIATRIEAEGLIPGIWARAFIVDESSVLFAEHPDWLQDPADAVLGGAVGPADGERALDLSNPEAIGWLGDLMRRYRDDWHMGWIKLDFSYLAFLFPPTSNPELSSVEAYHRAVSTVRDALGPDVFYLGIGLTGMNFGVVDGMRLTLDDGPIWEDEAPFDFANAGTLKGTVRTAARRYYLNQRVWINHADLLFFRTAPGAPTLTEEEAITHASFVGLSGSIVKFGEDLRTLTPAQIQIWRQLLPIYPAGARPMDLFTRHYPETYRLPIEGTLVGSDARWTVVGLLHWGSNYDYEADREPAEMPDAPRTYEIDLERWGLEPGVDYLAQEFWSETFLGVVRDRFERTVTPHGHEVIALRERTGAPQFLGHNRHFTQGGTDLVAETWDAATSTLTIRLDVDAGGADALPFEHRVRVYAAGRTAIATTDADATQTQTGEVVTYGFTPTTAGLRDIVVRFEG